MAMSDNINKLVWGIFAIGALSVALLPVGWSALTTQYNQEAATNNQTMNRVFGSSNTNTTYVKPLMAVIPGHLASITSVSVSNTTPTTLTITGVGFGSSLPGSGQIGVSIRNNTKNAEIDNTNGLTIQSWSDTQLVVVVPSSFNADTSTMDSLTLSVNSTSNENTATWNMIGWTVFPPILNLSVSGGIMIGQSTMITGTLTQDGGPVANRVITFSVPNGDGTVSPVTITTDSNGNFSTTYTAPNTGGTYTISASGDGVNSDVQIGVMAPTVTLNAINELVTNQTVTISGAVTMNGQPYANQSVTLNTSGGSIPSSVTTNSSGQFSTTYTAPSAAGNYTITASSDGSNASTTATVGTITITSMASNPTSVNLNGTSTISGQVNFNGTGMANATVSLSTTAGTLATSVTTNSLGQFSTTFTAPSTSPSSGSASITATYMGVSDSISVQVGIGIVGTISTEMYPDAIAYDSVNHDMYISENNVDVGVIDTSTNKVVDTIKNVATQYAQTGTPVYDPNNGYVYVPDTSSWGNCVFVIDPSTNTVITTVSTAENPSQIVVGKGYIYVYSQLSSSNYPNEITVINDSTNTASATIAVGRNVGGNNITYDDANQDLYVLNYTTGYVYVIHGDQYLTAISLGSTNYPEETAYDPNNGDIYVASYGSTDLTVINGSTNTAIGNIPIGAGGENVTFDPLNGNIYVITTSPSFSVYVINGSTNTVITSLGITPYSYQLAVDPKTGNVYVLNGYGTGYNSEVISGTTNSIISSFYLAGFNGWAYDNANGDMYIATVSDPGVVDILN